MNDAQGPARPASACGGRTTPTVGHWTPRRVLTAGPDDPMLRALDVMGERGVRHVLVLDAAGALVGIVSNRDVFRARALREDAAALSLRQIMTPAPLHVTTIDAPLGEAARLMHTHKVSALPVMSGREVVGVITSDDVLAAVALGHAMRPPG